MIYQHKNGSIIELKKDFGSVISGYILDDKLNRTERRFYATKHEATCVVHKSNIVEYKTKNGLNVCHKGWVVIDNVQHFIKDGYVVCNPSLNHSAWNITDPKSTCSECKELVDIEMEVKQLTLF